MKQAFQGQGDGGIGERKEVKQNKRGSVKKAKKKGGSRKMY